MIVELWGVNPIGIVKSHGNA